MATPKPPRRPKQDYLSEGWREGESRDPNHFYSRNDPFAPPKDAKKGVGGNPNFGPPGAVVKPPKLGNKRGRLSEKKSRKK